MNKISKISMLIVMFMLSVEKLQASEDDYDDYLMSRGLTNCPDGFWEYYIPVPPGRTFSGGYIILFEDLVIEGNPEKGIPDIILHNARIKREVPFTISLDPLDQLIDGMPDDGISE